MRREKPIKRRNPSGEIVWMARYTGRDGRRHIAKPSWNRGKGTFRRKADAQKAIDEAYGLSDCPDTLGDYAATWTERHPRSERTNATNDHRIGRVADVEVEGIPLKDWPLRELRRRHTLALVDHMLRTEGRATTGAVGILRALSAMAEDAITDEVCDLNPFKGIRIRANDPRAKKKPRPIRVFSFEEMHRFAKAAGRYEAMVRVFTDCGLRLGEVLPLLREDSTARRSKCAAPPTRAKSSRERRPITASPTPAASSPCRPLSPGYSKPKSTSTAPTATSSSQRHAAASGASAPSTATSGSPAQEASGLDIRPHECRHSYVTHLRAAGVNDADLAEIAGHRVETMLARYTHAVGGGFKAVRAVIK
jgi:integrase